MGGRCGAADNGKRDAGGGRLFGNRFNLATPHFLLSYFEPIWFNVPESFLPWEADAPTL